MGGVRRRNPSNMSSAAAAKVELLDEAAAKADAEAAAEGVKLRVLAWLGEAAAGSNEQPAGNPKLAAAQVMGKSQLSDWLCIEFDLSKITASKLQSIGSPKMVFAVTLEPRAEESVTGDPVMSAQGV
jgi:hypothetical protein